MNRFTKNAEHSAVLCALQSEIHSVLCSYRNLNERLKAWNREHPETNSVFGTKSVTGHAYYPCGLDTPMRNRWTSAVLFGAVWGLTPGVNAAEEPLSYTANNSCYCNLSANSSLHKRIVGTPVGGQTVMQVCERIGEGPALKKSAGQYNFPVFDDMQCGHGPGETGYRGLLSDMGPESVNAPKWDLAKVYSESSKTLAASTANKATLVTPEKADELAKSSEATKPATTSSGSTARRFKPRYVKVPSTSSGSNAERTKAVEKPVVAKNTPKPTPVQQPVVKKPVVVSKRIPIPTREYTQDQSDIESLPLAETIPMTGDVTESVTSTAPESNRSTVNETITTEEVIVAQEPLDEGRVIAENVNSAPNSTEQTIAVSNTFRMPPSVRASSREFEYISFTPVSYDFGGAGVRFTASTMQGDNLRLILRAALARTYHEGIVGASYVYTPREANRLTFALTGGVEYGRFTLEDQNIETTVSDSGFFAQINSRFVVNNRFELQGGVGISSFFDGDPHAFGAAFYHITKKLDLTGEFEVGDNDSLGLGIRYYY